MKKLKAYQTKKSKMDLVPVKTFGDALAYFEGKMKKDYYQKKLEVATEEEAVITKNQPIITWSAFRFILYYFNIMDY